MWVEASSAAFVNFFSSARTQSLLRVTCTGYYACSCHGLCTCAIEYVTRGTRTAPWEHLCVCWPPWPGPLHVMNLWASTSSSQRRSGCEWREWHRKDSLSIGLSIEARVHCMHMHPLSCGAACVTSFVMRAAGVRPSKTECRTTHHDAIFVNEGHGGFSGSASEATIAHTA